MITLDRVKTDGDLYEVGVQATNIVECTPKEDAPSDQEQSWVKYWDGQQIRSMVVAHCVTEVQRKVFNAKHGKKMG